MRSPRISRCESAAFAIAAIIACLAAHAAAAGVVTSQNITLHPGWNAIYVELEPVDDDPSQVFADVQGLESVWAWRNPVVTQRYFQRNPLGLEDSDWLRYFPPDTPAAFTGTLDRVYPNRPYLIEIASSAPATQSLQLRGRPSLRRQRWGANEFTLVGFPVEPGNEPTFGAWFEASPAHAEARIFRLEASGFWNRVADPDTTPIQSGEAYWVYTVGGSEHQGPLTVTLPEGDSVSFGASVRQQSVSVLPASGSGAVRFAVAADEDGSDLDARISYQSLQPVDFPTPSGGMRTVPIAQWRPIPDAGVANPLLAGTRSALDLAVDRNGLANESFALLEIVGAGARWRAEVSALPALGVAGGDDPHQGLWVGEVTLLGVSQTNAAVPDLEFDAALSSIESDGSTLELIPAGSQWAAGELGSASFAFAGPAPLGYGNVGLNTQLPATGPYRFRRLLLGALLPPSPRLRLSLRVDDGAIVTLNGNPVIKLDGKPLRVNLPAAGAADQRPLQSVERSDYQSYEFIATDWDNASFFNDLQVAVYPYEILQPVAADSCAATCGEIAASGCSCEASCVDAGTCCGDYPSFCLDGPAPVEHPFTFRLIVHVDAHGNARLLEDVIQLNRAQQRGPEGLTPVEPVLLTDDTRISDFDPATFVDGRPVGRRISSVAFDLDERSPGWDAEARGVALEPRVGTGFGDGIVSAQVVDAISGATNPFRHAYHPDHDNLDASYEPYRGRACLNDGSPCTQDSDCGFVVGQCSDDPGREVSVEVPEIVRDIELEFSARDPAAPGINPTNPPEFGTAVVGGIYRESVRGLHKDPIDTIGTFRLERVSTIPILNPPMAANP